MAKSYWRLTYREFLDLLPPLQRRRFARSARDAAVIDRVVRGESRAFNELVNRYTRPLTWVANRYTGDKALSKEAVQNAFVSAFNSLDKFKQDSAFFTWMFRITVNAAISIMRRQKRERAAELREDELAASEESSAADREAKRQDAIERVLDVVGKLGPKHREVLALQVLEEMSYDEIAETLGIPVGTVMSRLYYARKRIRDIESGAADAPKKRPGRKPKSGIPGVWIKPRKPKAPPAPKAPLVTKVVRRIKPPQP